MAQAEKRGKDVSPLGRKALCKGLKVCDSRAHRRRCWQLSWDLDRHANAAGGAAREVGRQAADQDVYW